MGICGAWHPSLGVDPPCRADVLEAVAAVYRFAGRRAEWNLRHLPARGTDRLVELPRCRVGDRHRSGLPPRLPLFLVAAAPAARRLVLEATVLVEILFSHREDKFFTAIPTFDYLVYVSHEASETNSPDETKTPPTGEYRGGTPGHGGCRERTKCGTGTGERSLYSTRCCRYSVNS